MAETLATDEVGVMWSVLAETDQGITKSVVDALTTDKVGDKPISEKEMQWPRGDYLARSLAVFGNSQAGQSLWSLKMERFLKSLLSRESLRPPKNSCCP